MPARRIAHQIHLHRIRAVGRQLRLKGVAAGRTGEQGFVLAGLADVEVIRRLTGFQLDAEGLAGLGVERVFCRGIALDLALDAERGFACRQCHGFLVDRIGAPGGRRQHEGGQEQAGADGGMDGWHGVAPWVAIARAACPSLADTTAKRPRRCAKLSLGVPQAWLIQLNTRTVE